MLVVLLLSLTVLSVHGHTTHYPDVTTDVPEFTDAPVETTDVPEFTDAPAETTEVPEFTERPAETTEVPEFTDPPAETTEGQYETTEESEDQYETLRKQLETLTETVEMLVALSKGALIHGQSADPKDATLRQKVEILTENVGNLQENMGDVQAQIAAIDLHQDDQETRLSKLMQVPNCFSAVKTETQSAAAGDSILFEEELVDTYNTYNPTSGVYIIPEDGVYEVIVTLYKSSDHSCNTVGNVYVGDTFLTRIRSDIRDIYAATQSTSSIIREFQADDELRVEAGTACEFVGTSYIKGSQFSAKYLGAAPSA